MLMVEVLPVPTPILPKGNIYRLAYAKVRKFRVLFARFRLVTRNFFTDYRLYQYHVVLPLHLSNPNSTKFFNFPHLFENHTRFFRIHHFSS